ncbi:TetR/AcrR family transcriptional regulator [Natronococcus sp.]|uniref:TetR/AcrR family transcriptional regulator n=1 Tax=Natronococcus sp. TaxID=35747 RepID=UPI003A4DF96D
MGGTSGAERSGTLGDDLDETTAAIMEAVYRALSRNGYPATTMSEIAAEFDKSKSLLYYHYESKEEILNDFFAHLCERLEATLVEDPYDDPHEQLLALIDRLLPAEMDDESLRFRRAFFEIRSQAPHNQSYHEQIERSDEIILEALTETIRRGVDEGRFADFDSEREAELLFSTIYGIMERGVTLEDRAIIERNREAVHDRIDRWLLEDE